MIVAEGVTVVIAATSLVSVVVLVAVRVEVEVSVVVEVGVEVVVAPVREEMVLVAVFVMLTVDVEDGVGMFKHEQALLTTEEAILPRAAGMVQGLDDVVAAARFTSAVVG